MIKDRVVAARYADAFFKYAKTTGALDKILADLNSVKDILRKNAEFNRLLEHPGISYLDKCDIIDKVVNSGFCDEIRHLLKLLIEHRRMQNFFDIAEYTRVKYAQGGEEALIKTSYPLELSLIKRIETKIEERFKRKFKFYIALDGTLLGGIQVTIGNKVIDGSIRRRLDDLKDMLMAAEVS
jgi:F-type H+-transporting ATPase subunit delta